MSAFDSPQLVLAVTFFILVAAIMIVAMFRYQVEGALKIFTGVSGLLGVMCGSIGTYYYNKPLQEQTQQLQQQASQRADAAEQRVAVLRQQKDEAVSQAVSLHSALVEAQPLIVQAYGRATTPTGNPETGPASTIDPGTLNALLKHNDSLIREFDVKKIDARALESFRKDSGQR